MGTRMKCRVGGKRERIDRTKDTLIGNCRNKVKGRRNGCGGWWEERRDAE